MLLNKKLLLPFTCLLFIISSMANAEKTQEISQQQLLSLQTAPSAPVFIVLDVRSAEEFAQGHIPNAINISHDEIGNKLDKLTKYKDSLVVVHCRSGRRAVSAENILAENGFTKLRHLHGDMNAWQESELPTVMSQ